ncbi:MAG: hypothetical protein KC543_11305 [Myxococcales bacterium]|nr:hypothetical protein [Myxococcales bacterium]
MSFLTKEFFAQSPVLALPLLALAIFLVVFVAVSVRALRMKDRETDRLAHLALDEAHDE